MVGESIVNRKALSLLAPIVLVFLAVLYGLNGGEQRPYIPEGAGGPEIAFHASDAASVTFAVIGDYGDDSEAEARVAGLVRSLNPDLIITTGDNNYPAGSAETIDRNIGKHYSSYIHPYKGVYGGGSPEVNRFFPSLGNHDWPPSAHLEYFELPGNERYYDFTWGPVHFFAINTNVGEPDGIDADSTQAMWLMRKLAASDMPFKFVYGHHPPYSSGKHGSFEELRWPFSKWEADAFFSGHDHTYERLLVGGIPYFVVGLGGKSIYPFKRLTPGSAFMYNTDYGALFVTVDEGRALSRFYSVMGNLVDEYEIAR